MKKSFFRSYGGNGAKHGDNANVVALAAAIRSYSDVTWNGRNLSHRITVAGSQGRDADVAGGVRVRSGRSPLPQGDDVHGRPP